MLHINLHFLNIINLILISNLVEYSLESCISEDGLTRNLNSVWINNKGCRCSCVGLDEITFVQCEECKSNVIGQASSVSIRKICQNNGFDYFENETWMSPKLMCTECKCQIGGEITCTADKHCRNTCPLGQIPKYGNCCEVTQCSGKSLPYEDSIKCWDLTSGIPISHGKISIRRHTCVDKICICYNGNWLCHNYCQLSNNTFKYWHRLCCSRPIGTQKCTNSIQNLMPGEKSYFKEIDDNCTCLSGNLYCDKSFHLNLLNNFNVTSLPQSNKSLPVFITLLSLIGFVLCCFIIVVFFSNFDKYKQKILYKDKLKNDKLLYNNQDSDPNIQESPIDISI